MNRATRALAVGFAVAFAGCAPTWEGGIHARLGWHRERGLRVVEVQAESAAFRAGVRVGDRIESIGGVPIEGLELPEVRDRLGGPVGSTVRVSVRHANGAVEELVITRAPYAPHASHTP